mgnify:CR=1 FL=1
MSIHILDPGKFFPELCFKFQALPMYERLCQTSRFLECTHTDITVWDSERMKKKLMQFEISSSHVVTMDEETLVITYTGSTSFYLQFTCHRASAVEAALRGLLAVEVHRRRYCDLPIEVNTVWSEGG